MEKSPDAFRTISEVADWLGVPTHVLRFWESRFPQVKPVKRAGGRRYYRPADMMLLGGIKRLLHDDGMTIRGVQKMLREEGVRHVSSFSQPLDALEPMRDVTPEEEDVAPSPMAVDVEPEPLRNVVALPTPPESADGEALAPAPAEDRLILGAKIPDGGTDTSEPLLPAEDEALSPSDRDAGPAEAAEEPAAEDEKLPELSFLRRAAPAPEPEAPQPDLFSSRRAPEPLAEPPRPRIPPTPDVPDADAPDDDAATPARPGVAARLRVHPLRPDHAAIARAVADLHALRARL